MYTGATLEGAVKLNNNVSPPVPSGLVKCILIKLESCILYCLGSNMSSVNKKVMHNQYTSVQ